MTDDTNGTKSAGTNLTVTPTVFERDGAVFADSRDVAACFGKRHADVLRSIEKTFEINADAKLRWLKQAVYIDAQGKERPFYELTKDGFTLLAMGFTGPKALQFKIAYIERFNAMEPLVTY